MDHPPAVVTKVFTATGLCLAALELKICGVDPIQPWTSRATVPIGGGRGSFRNQKQHDESGMETRSADFPEWAGWRWPGVARIVPVRPSGALGFGVRGWGVWAGRIHWQPGRIGDYCRVDRRARRAGSESRAGTDFHELPRNGGRYSSVGPNCEWTGSHA